MSEVRVGSASDNDSFGDAVPETASVTTTTAPEVTTTTAAPDLPPAAQTLLNKLLAGSNEKVMNIVHHERRMAEVTVKEVRDAIAVDPNHPVAINLEFGTRGLLGSQTVYIEQIDLQAMLQRQQMEIRQETIDGRIVSTKHLV